MSYNYSQRLRNRDIFDTYRWKIRFSYQVARTRRRFCANSSASYSTVWKWALGTLRIILGLRFSTNTGKINAALNAKFSIESHEDQLISIALTNLSFKDEHLLANNWYCVIISIARIRFLVFDAPRILSCRWPSGRRCGSPRCGSRTFCDWGWGSVSLTWGGQSRWTKRPSAWLASRVVAP